MIWTKGAKRRRKTGKQRTLPEPQRRLLYERTRGRCEWCGLPMSYPEMADHHRKLRSAGGGWELSNQLGVHHGCHNVQPRSIHQNPALAMQRGAIVSAYADPALAWVWISGRWWTLDDDGGKTEQADHLPF